MQDLPANLKPSLLDRLVDVSLLGTASPLWYTPGEMLEAVRRDVEALLNTRQTCRGLCDGYAEVGNSLVGYGIPDAASLTVDTARQRGKVAREIEEAIRRFEPRLSQVKATILDPAARKDRLLRLRIAARLNVEPAMDVDFDGSMELTTGRISMAIPS